MERKIANCFSQRKSNKNVMYDCNVEKNKCKILRFDSFVSRTILLLLFLSFSFAILGAKSRITDTRYDIERVGTGQQGTVVEISGLCLVATAHIPTN